MDLNNKKHITSYNKETIDRAGSTNNTLFHLYFLLILLFCFPYFTSNVTFSSNGYNMALAISGATLIKNEILKTETGPSSCEPLINKEENNFKTCYLKLPFHLLSEIGSCAYVLAITVVRKFVSDSFRLRDRILGRKLSLGHPIFCLFVCFYLFQHPLQHNPANNLEYLH